MCFMPTRLSSFSFPLEPCHAHLFNRAHHFLTYVKLRNMERVLVKIHLNCFLNFFFSRSKGEKNAVSFLFALLNDLKNIPFLQYINKTGFRDCLKELYEAKYDPVSVTYSVLSGKSSTATKPINFNTYQLSG